LQREPNLGECRYLKGRYIGLKQTNKAKRGDRKEETKYTYTTINLQDHRYSNRREKKIVRGNRESRRKMTKNVEKVKAHCVIKKRARKNARKNAGCVHQITDGKRPREV